MRGTPPVDLVEQFVQQPGRNDHTQTPVSRRRELVSLGDRVGIHLKVDAGPERRTRRRAPEPPASVRGGIRRAADASPLCSDPMPRGRLFLAEAERSPAVDDRLDGTETVQPLKGTSGPRLRNPPVPIVPDD
ncbi:hypothetical protein GCM10010129_17810 [Streptomyces fumigatiscleroticus]|nr:hypothetical protein GCM10010129_17810 [Streptomyces fumigatiscleroticus]